MVEHLSPLNEFEDSESAGDATSRGVASELTKLEKWAEVTWREGVKLMRKTQT